MKNIKFAQIEKVIEEDFVSYNIRDLESYDYVDGFNDFPTAKYYAKQYGYKIQGNLIVIKFGVRIK